ncbi:hypothetical protein HMPREF3201_02232 [Megasphaera sp. MJR8396C]|nr:hypothetical protein HMPREF3201_02232 [Megasphaera sp. MJR8396C]
MTVAENYFLIRRDCPWRCRCGQSLLVLAEPCYNKIKFLFLPVAAETISDSL